VSNFKLELSLHGAEKLTLMRQLLEPTTFNRGMKGGIQYAAKAAAPSIAKQVGQFYSLKAARIKAAILKPRFYSGGLAVSIPISRRPPTAFSYGAKYTPGKGIAVSFIRGNRKVFPKGFVLNVPTKDGDSNQLPFMRVGKERKDIKVISGPSVGSEALGTGRFATEIKAAVTTRATEQFMVGIERELQRISRGR
jgi:hypothetical protein